MMNTSWTDREDREIARLRELYEDAGGEIFPAPNWKMIGDKMRRLTTPEEKRLTAYHEAGHAVMCLTEGAPIVKVTVKAVCTGRPPWTRFGCCTHDAIPEHDALTRLRKDVGISMAGEIAERMLQGDPLGEMFDYSEDREGIARGNEYGDEWKRRRWIEVRDALRRNWRQVVALAEALLERETLSGEEVEALLHELPAHERVRASVADVKSGCDRAD